MVNEQQGNAKACDPSFWSGKRVLVTGGSGFVGRNLVPLLERRGCDVRAPSHREFDLLEQEHVRRLLLTIRPQMVFHLAGLVGGILATKQYPADFCYENLLMSTMTLKESWQAGVEKYVTLMGGCSYPAHAPNPIRESELWNGYPQGESAAFSTAKRMDVVLAQAYRDQWGFDAIVLVPGNLYGPHDNFDLDGSHVIPALIRRFNEARMEGKAEVAAWGTGQPIRDFIYIGDACEAIVRAAEVYSGKDIINISSGAPTTIRELVETIADLVGYKGRVRWDASKPDGQMRKVFDVAQMRDLIGYQPTTSLREGLARTLEWFTRNRAHARLEVRR